MIEEESIVNHQHQKENTDKLVKLMQEVKDEPIKSIRRPNKISVQVPNSKVKIWSEKDIEISPKPQLNNILIY